MGAISQLFVKHLSHGFFYHCSVLINTVGKRHIRKARDDLQFIFNTNWIFEESCKRCIKDFWDSSWIRLPMILEGLGFELNKWAKEN